MPSRSFGTQLQVRTAALQIALGGYRTPIGTDAVAIDTDGDVEGGPGIGWDLGTRVAYQRQGPQHGFFEIQASALIGREEGTLEAPALIRLSSVTQQPLLLFQDGDERTAAVVANGARLRTAVGGLWLHRGWLLSAEGALWQQRLQQHETMHTVRAHAMSARVAYVWRGERRPTLEIRPRPPRRGAVEIGARAGQITAAAPQLAALVERGSIARAQHVGGALSWLPTSLTRLTLAYDLTWGRVLTGPGRLTEHGLQLRWQQAF